ncbi:MAG TPA: sigma-70 family RNA polymerase sigma factor [Thermoanaerobaculia bacterium]|jgi:RNA polymerase sigma factor (TIGR02999 family)|nr:sigma-70 family RNA polymerase sigma factor [Thermoanaerobaculia bacterium]
MDESGDVTRLLIDWRRGDKEALDRLMPVVYGELHRLAEIYLHRERPGNTLQPTALVNEAYLRLIDQRQVEWQSRAHFFGIAAQMMRRILVDHARAHRADKRGGGLYRVMLDSSFDVEERRDIDLIALDGALEALAKLDPRQSRIVELRFFVGLTIEETAEVIGVSPITVRRDWNLAKAWLYREIGRGEKRA